MRTRTEAPAGEPLAREGRIELRGVRREYRARRRSVPALDGLSLSVGEREVVGVVGPSGCGKSTLLELVAGLQEPDAGSVEAAGAADRAGRLAACSYMPQRDMLLPWRDALGNAALALECGGLSRVEARRRAEAHFERFGLARFERTRPAALSGGMRQRVAFLRTLLPGRPVLLLDEPFASLDAITRHELQAWLRGALAADPRTVLLVTHDVEEAIYLADRVVVLSGRPGRVVDEIPVALDTSGPRREVVTGPAFAALAERALEALEG